MDKTAIKNFAVSARQKLIKAVSQKAYDIGIMEDSALPVAEVLGGFRYKEKSYTKDEFTGRKKLVEKISNSADGKGYKHGYGQVMEEVAYTWFNRLIALRFMEVNGYLPSNIRILSSLTPDRIEPDVIREVESLDYVDMSKISDDIKNNTEKLYKHILIAQCNELSKIMPKMFQNIADYTELLLPDKLYLGEGIIRNLVDGIKEDDFKEQVEIIGWLYQYYISEKKDDVFAALKKNVKITKENIPAATQLFTPDWIVKYMVENSLGRLAVEKLNLNPDDLGWKYYLAEAQQNNEVKQQLEIINADDKDCDIKNVKVIDPCMGSGHILVYAFDVLYQIYESLGYSTKDIPNLILTHNIYGLDIDDRAGQLAYFALMMKARSKSRRFFRDEFVPQSNTYSIIESDGVDAEHLKIFDNADITYLHALFADAKEYGSILKIERDIHYDNLLRFINDFQIPEQLSFDTQGFEDSKAILREIISIAKLLTQKYDAAITNPPYMGGSGMGGKLSDYVKKNFADSKSDLFSCFIEQGNLMVKPNSYNCMVTMQSWMFLSSFEKMRKNILTQKTISNLMHMDNMVMGIAFGTAVVVIKNAVMLEYKGTYNHVKMCDMNDEGVPFEFPVKDNRFAQTNAENFAKIPGMPVAYWVSEKMLSAYENSICLKDFASPRAGLATGDNTIFQKLWHEVQKDKIGFNYSDVSETTDNKFKWFPCNSGGEFRKWSTNDEYVVNWENNGYELKNFKNSSGKLASRPQNTQYYFKKGITWNKLSSSRFAVKYKDKGYIYDDTSRSAFIADKKNLFYLTGFLCSSVTFEYLKALNPTMSFTNGDLERLPFIFSEQYKSIVDKLVSQNITISKTDWDSFETSWDFVRHPLLKFGVVFDTETGEKEGRIELFFKFWKDTTNDMFNQLKANEEELNRIFIEIYGLQDELTPEVADKDVTIRKSDLVRDVKSFISYAVGCMFGRYSLDVDGLAYAGGKFDNSKYKTYIPVDDNIIPITDNDYFDDDIVLRFIEFVRTVYGNATLDENLDFIANALYPNANGTTTEKIRRYFLNDFYKDHVKIYQKKPIYWQFESGKIGGFKALVYLHRYDKYTVARVRTDYLHPLQRKYEATIKNLETLSEMTDNVSEKAGYKKTTEDLHKKINECRVYDQVVAHIAHQTIELDLDDGVTVNYAKFQGVEVPQGDGKADVKMDLLSKI